MTAESIEPLEGTVTSSHEARLAQARLTYVQGVDDPDADLGVRYPDLPELAEQFGIGITTLERASRSQGWAAQRDQLSVRYVAARTAQRFADNSRRAIATDAQVYRLGEAGLQIANRVLVAMGQTALRAPAELDVKDFKIVVEVVEKLHRTMRAATGDPIPEIALTQPPSIAQVRASAEAEDTEADAPSDDLIRDVARYIAELESGSAEVPQVIYGEIVDGDG